jgi:hypothetical protein
MIDELVEKYVALRDKKADYAAKIKELNAGMDRIEEHLMAEMNKQGVKSMSTGAGTAYIQHKTAATVADWPAVLDFIKKNEMWTMLEKRVSKTVIDEYRSANDNDMPPGISWYETLALNVRRS